MKLFVNGSVFGNLLLIGAGAVFGAFGYWTAEQWGIVPEPSDREGAEGAAYLKGDGHGTVIPRSKAARSSAGEAGKPYSLERLREERLGSEPLSRSERLRRAGAEGARGNLEEALVFGHSLNRLQDKLDYFRGLFGVWSDVDAEAALAYAKGHFSTGLLQSEMIGLVVNKWGAGHPQEARMWAEQNLSGTTKERALTDLMIGWTRRSPDSAAAWLDRSENGSASIVSAVGRTWAEQDPEAAALWLGGMPAGVAKRAGTLAVANEWTRQDPQDAAEFFEKDLDGADGLDLATIIADVWGTSDPESAALWVADLPAGAVRDQAAGGSGNGMGNARRGGSGSLERCDRGRGDAFPGGRSPWNDVGRFGASASAGVAVDLAARSGRSRQGWGLEFLERGESAGDAGLGGELRAERD